MATKDNFQPKSFAVVGAGPVGCIVAAFLSRGGYDVTLCDVIPQLLAPAEESGIIIDGAENLKQRITRTCPSVDDLAIFDPDVIFITVKANALPLIASAIESFHHDDMVVISWQNGIDTEMELAKFLGKKTVMRAVVNYGCSLTAPAHVHMPFHHPPHYLQEMDPEAADRARMIATVLTECGLRTDRTDKIISMVWRKGVLNACMNPVCAVTGMTMAQAMNDPIVFNTVDSLVKECIKIARANEINLGWDFYPYAIAYMKNAGNHKPSMLMDIENRRRTEIDYINGKFIDYGRQAGIETPFNSTLKSLVKGIESRL
jgi:2-dehydropantoate 2-reductase